jgi:hypothetical protein
MPAISAVSFFRHNFLDRDIHERFDPMSYSIAHFPVSTIHLMFYVTFLWKYSYNDLSQVPTQRSPPNIYKEICHITKIMGGYLNFHGDNIFTIIS